MGLKEEPGHPELKIPSSGTGYGNLANLPVKKEPPFEGLKTLMGQQTGRGKPPQPDF